jgi:hypothetical protein
VVRRAVRSGACIYVLVCAASCALQRKLQYFPDAAPVPLPADLAQAGMAEVELEAADGTRLWGWDWPGTRAATLIIFHGNAGHRGDRREWVNGLHERLSVGIFILDYRGYGGSGGSPSEEGLYLDAEAAISWVAQRRPQDRLVYLGESLGSGVAVELALRRPPAALIVQGGFSAAVDVAARVYRFLPVRLLMKDRFDSARKIGGLRCPLLQVHGDQDEVIPLDLGRALFDAAPEPKEWVPVPGAGHNDLVWAGGRRYFEALGGFLRRRLGA